MQLKEGIATVSVALAGVSPASPIQLCFHRSVTLFAWSRPLKSFRRDAGNSGRDDRAPQMLTQSFWPRLQAHSAENPAGSQIPGVNPLPWRNFSYSLLFAIVKD
jgi:hypothetical protein